jgi:small subunit ribosomal protein S1
VHQGDDVDVKIIEIDPDRRRLSLSLKRVQPDDDVKTIELQASGNGGVPELGLSDEVFADDRAGDEVTNGEADAAADEVTNGEADAAADDVTNGEADVDAGNAATADEDAGEAADVAAAESDTADR